MEAVTNRFVFNDFVYSLKNGRKKGADFSGVRLLLCYQYGTVLDISYCMDQYYAKNWLWH